jgi:hypothetical protein
MSFAMISTRHGPWAGLLCVLGLVACSAAKPVDPRTAQFSKLPDWHGIWVSAEPIGNIGISGYPPADFFKDWKIVGFTAPYNATGKAAFDQFLAQMSKLGDNVKGATGWSFPQMMEAPTPLQFTITPDETVIVNFYRDIRHVYTDGRSHPAEDDRWPTPWGDSIGHWEGDTLVIDTVSVERPTQGPPFPLLSEQAHFVERLRMTAPDRIESELTVTDPAMLAEPWVIKLSYKRAPAMDRMFHNHFDNDRDVVSGDFLTIEPPKEASP